MTGRPVLTVPGMGAAGGMAVPFVGWLNSTLRSGLDIVLDAQGFDALHQL